MNKKIILKIKKKVQEMYRAIKMPRKSFCNALGENRDEFRRINYGVVAKKFGVDTEMAIRRHEDLVRKKYGNR